MRLSGPHAYALTFNSKRYRVVDASGRAKFTGLTAKRWPKIYAFVVNRRIAYVGITRQPMSTRLRLGWKATGESGYHGYAIRRHLKSATLFVWHADRDEGPRSAKALETVEAEVAYLIRKAGQWPQFQTEIHFYPSTATDRSLARRLVRDVSRAP